MITLDTSALFAFINRRDPDHARVRASFEAATRPYLVPAGILAEITYLIESRLGNRVLETFLDDLIEGAYTFDCGEEDLPRARQLVARYADLPLGLADASVIACAERNGGLVLTLDERHFRVVQGDVALTILP